MGCWDSPGVLRLECSDMCTGTARQGRGPREAERELYAGHPQIVLLLI